MRGLRGIRCLRGWIRAWFFLVLVSAVGCAGARPLLPDVPEPAAGYWFDDFRQARVRLDEPELLAGAAKVRITPRSGVRIAGHGFNKHAKGILDDLWVRALYLDTGEEAVALVSLDLIGLSAPRIKRIRQRISRRHALRILVAATHNHAGPDSLGFWGPAVFGLLPTRSGIDEAYMERVEKAAARAVILAVARARPARLGLGRFLMPEGLAVNLREPGDVERTVRLMRLSDSSGMTIATVVHYANHAESLQDRNRWLSADFPGVLYRELDAILGGVTLFFTGPAGGMIEPSNDPADDEAERLAFREKLGGSLAAGTLRAVIAGLRKPAPAPLRLRTMRLVLPLQADGLLRLAMNLGLMDPRPVAGEQIETEMALLDWGELSMLFLPGEPSPELGRALRARLKGDLRMVIGVALDELGYLLSDRQWADARFEYERSMSVGPAAANRIMQALECLQSDSCTGP